MSSTRHNINRGLLQKQCHAFVTVLIGIEASLSQFEPVQAMLGTRPLICSYLTLFATLTLTELMTCASGYARKTTLFRKWQSYDKA